MLSWYAALPRENKGRRGGERGWWWASFKRLERERESLSGLGRVRGEEGERGRPMSRLGVLLSPSFLQSDAPPLVAPLPFTSPN